MPLAQGGRLFRGARCLDALNIEKVVAIMASTIRLQLKFTPLSTNLAIRTLVLIFYASVSLGEVVLIRATYQVFHLLLLCRRFMLLQHLLFSKCWAERVVDLSSRCAWYPHSTLQRRSRCERNLDWNTLGLPRAVILRDVAEAYI